MKAKANSRTIAIAARMHAPTANGVRRSFASGLLMGLGSASLMIAGQIPRPAVSLGSLQDDWRAVSGDIRTAAKKHGGT
jgi:hypothetical protein